MEKHTVTLFCCIISTLSATKAASIASYVVPAPTFEVLSPVGFRVSIPHHRGVNLFAFHGNINVPMDHLEAGQFSVDIVKKTDDRWVYENKDAVLKEGDKIYYWLFVIKHKLGYRYDNGEYLVKDYSVNSINDEEDKFSNENQPSEESTSKTNNSTNKTTSSGKSRCLSSIAIAEVLAKEVDDLKATNKILSDIAQKDLASATTLKLDGVLPPYKDVQYTAQIIVREKLGLNIPVIGAVKNSDSTISFQVPSLEDKISVIRAAKEKLVNSNSKIILII